MLELEKGFESVNKTFRIPVNIVEQLDQITVFIFARLINTVAFRTKSEMIGNHRALTVIKCFVGGKQCFCLPLFEK